jgi:hypothetical protein
MSDTEAAPQAARGATIDGPQDEPPWPPGALLKALRWAWDGAYMITGHSEGGLLVTRMDGHGSFRAGDPLEARDAIRADHARLPVARPIEEGALGRRLAFERAHPEVMWGVPTRYHKAIWTDSADNPQEEVALTVDGMLSRLRTRGFTW